MKFKKLIKFIALSLTLSFLIVGCEQEVSTENQLSGNFVGLSQSARAIYLDEGQTVSVDVKLVASKSVNTDRVVDLEVIYTSVQNTAAAPNKVPVTTADPANFTAPTSVTIPAGETVATFQVTMTSTDLGEGKTVVLGIIAKEGVDIDTRFVNTRGKVNYEIMSPRVVLKFRPICNLNPFQVQITTDQYGSETDWELYDGDLNLIAAGGPYDDLDKAGVFEQEVFDICLPDGNYTFVVYDSENDGMNSGYGEGFYRLVKMNGDYSVEQSEIASGGVFGANEVTEFSFP